MEGCRQRSTRDEDVQARARRKESKHWEEEAEAGPAVTSLRATTVHRCADLRATAPDLPLKLHSQGSERYLGVGIDRAIVKKPQFNVYWYYATI